MHGLIRLFTFSFLICGIVSAGCCGDCETVEVFNTTEFRYINATSADVTIRELYRSTDSVLASSTFAAGDSLLRHATGWNEIAFPFASYDGSFRVQFESPEFGCWEYQSVAGQHVLGTGMGPFNFHNYVEFDSLTYVSQQSNILTYFIDSLKFVDGIPCP